MLNYLNAKPGDVFEADATLANATWVRSERPNQEEKDVLFGLGIDEDILADALDPHEVPRVELADGWTYFITRLPDTDDDFNDYTTPILFALTPERIVTVSRDSLGRLWGPFIETTHITKDDRATVFIAMIDEIATLYQRRVATINRQMRAATSDVVRLSSKDIVTLTEYERKLNDFLDAIIPTNTALEKLLGGRLLKMREEDKELFEDR